jgi:aspartate kinase
VNRKAGEPVVQKFGGSSLSTFDKVRHVARKVISTHDSGCPVVVVVSAMGNTTTELIEQAREVSEDPPPRELDVLLSSGERMSMALLAMAIQSMGRPAVSLTGPDCGIHTDGNHLQAKIVDVRPDRVRHELEQGRIVIVAGFQGATPAGEIATLGRGGSDTTAVALACALGAPICEIYSDVPGVFTADPRVVDEPLHLKRVGARLMSEYARHGAVVLHPPCLEHARENGVAIRTLATFGDGTSTIIAPGHGVEYSDADDREIEAIVGVSSRKKRLRVHTDRVDDALASTILERLSGLDMFHATSRARALDVLVGTENVPDPDAFGGELEERVRGLARVTSGLASISAIAETEKIPELPARIRGALDAAGTEVLSIYRRPLSVTCAIRGEDRVAAVQALHETLIPASGSGPAAAATV